MGEIPGNTSRRFFKKGARTVYLRMEAADRLLYKDVFIRERGYDERVASTCPLFSILETSRR